MAIYDLYKMTSDVKYPPEWVQLRREIEEWSRNYESPFNEIPCMTSNYQSLKNAIYIPIKLALGLKTINDIETWQVPKARRIFYEIREICEGVDPDDISKY
ncbi:hypothetical protein [Companilactobacillus nodensis]|uniref:hypothetical protein n=1 Tax=Companilactobacillus nodensis TaxID=460870 RepID=UPI000469923F|nr:hypothetical protein [Companilactobacillus nodensis]